MKLAYCAVAAALLLAGSAWAQGPEAPAEAATDPAAETVTTPAVEATASSAQSGPAPGMIRIPAGTAVIIELTETMRSTSAQQGALFGLRLAEPIALNDAVIVPAGAVGGGEVIDARPAGGGGRQGRLILSSRYLEINGERVRIRAMQFMAAGEDRAADAAGVAAAGAIVWPLAFAGFLVRGGEVEIPAGTRGTARLAADLDVPVAAATPAPSAPITQTQEGENQP